VVGEGAPASHMVYLIEPQGEACKLTIEHYDIAPGQEGFTRNRAFRRRQTDEETGR
jgi:hypothetical protein